MTDSIDLIDRAPLHVTKDLLDRGRVLEAGWAAYAHLLGPARREHFYEVELRFAFMVGAQHLFTSLKLDEETEPTDEELRRMEMIREEMEEWRERLLERLRD